MTVRVRVATVAAASVLAVSGCGGSSWAQIKPDRVAVALINEHVGTSSVEPSTDLDVSGRLGVLLTVASDELGEPYEWGGDGPSIWDCSSFVRHAYSEVGIRMPRTARAQRDWMADGHGIRIASGEEQPGDLIFWDDYLGPDEIGHVAMVWDPDESSTIEARTPETGFYRYGTEADHSRFEVWRATDLTMPATSSKLA